MTNNNKENGSKTELYPRELAVLSQLDAEGVLTQRDLASRTGYSVGLINMTLKKLVSTGYIKTVNLNRRQLKYLLTPEGFAAISKKSYRYVLNTIQHYQSLRQKIVTVITNLVDEGYVEFSLNGNGELRQLIQETIENDFTDPSLILHESHGNGEKRTILNLNSEPFEYEGKVVDFLKRITA
jgi:DNA-binding Lrp family transcriptional regulator